ncbi:hypothetical protein M2436_003622 [Streptomyces sp. HB372]|nr:hypothetical protein [Streptomyces sp. HB372]
MARVQPIFDALKPEGDFGSVHAGKVGAGHFAKMVHNGIEYAMMQAYAEGWELLEKVDSVTDVREVFRSWQEGTVIRSWLLDLAVNALDDDEHLDKLRGFAADSGEGRWTVEAAIDNAVPLPAITASLFARFASRQDDSPQMKMIAALRNQFGRARGREQEVARGGKRGSTRTTARHSGTERPGGRRTCMSPISRWPTSARTPGSRSLSTRASPRSWGPTGRARPTSSRPSAISPPSAATGSPRTPRWCGWARSGR